MTFNVGVESTHRARKMPEFCDPAHFLLRHGSDSGRTTLFQLVTVGGQREGYMPQRSSHAYVIILELLLISIHDLHVIVIIDLSDSAVA